MPLQMRLGYYSRMIKLTFLAALALSALASLLSALGVAVVTAASLIQGPDWEQAGANLLAAVLLVAVSAMLAQLVETFHSSKS